MAKIVSSYCTKVVGENKIFKETIRIYRSLCKCRNRK